MVYAVWYMGRTVSDGSIGRRIKAAREEKGIGQSELADMAEIRAQSLWRYEDGRQDPGTHVLHRIARALDVSMDWLMTGHRRESTPPLPPKTGTHDA